MRPRRVRVAAAKLAALLAACLLLNVTAAWLIAAFVTHRHFAWGILSDGRSVRRVEQYSNFGIDDFLWLHELELLPDDLSSQDLEKVLARYRKWQMSHVSPSRTPAAAPTALSAGASVPVTVESGPQPPAPTVVRRPVWSLPASGWEYQATGWPLRALTSRMAHSAAERVPRIGLEYGFRWAEGSSIAVVGPVPGMTTTWFKDARALPLRPVWRGMIGNTVLYALGALALRGSLRAGRAWRRRRVGACIGCGYCLKGIPEGRCPECGGQFQAPASVV